MKEEKNVQKIKKQVITDDQGKKYGKDVVKFYCGKDPWNDTWLLRKNYELWLILSSKNMRKRSCV